MSLGQKLTIRETIGVTIPTLIAGAGERAAWRFLEFFTVNTHASQPTATRAMMRLEVCVLL
jgi:hypothetical protein